MLALSQRHALYPVIQYLSRAAGFAATDRPEARIEKLGACLRNGRLLTPPRFRYWPSCCRSGGGAEPSSQTPAQRKRRRSPSLSRVPSQGESDTVLIVLEDAHWIDATTLEMMMRLTDSIGRREPLHW